MIEGYISQILSFVTQLVNDNIVITILLSITIFILLFRKSIDYLLMKDDKIWRRWYKGKYLCPSCHKRLKPHDYPPNYLCKKCGNTFVFGDQAVKEWIKHKPLMTKGEFVRRLMLLGLLALSAVYIFHADLF